MGNSTSTYKCEGDIPVPNCYQADPKDPKKCSFCRRHYYLTESNECKEIEISHCLSATEINGEVFCSLCDEANLSANYKECIRGSVPSNCMSGNVNGEGCLLCQPGYFADSFKRTCLKGEILGCGIYDNNNNCLECDTFHGYYAVDAVERSGKVYQTECWYGAEMIRLMHYGVLFLSSIDFNL